MIKKCLFLLTCISLIFSYLSALSSENVLPANQAKTNTEKSIYAHFIKQIIADQSIQQTSLEKQHSYENLIKRFPNNKTIQKDYFLFQIKSGDIQKAYEYGLTLKNTHFEFLTMMGYICIALEKYDEALEYLDKIDPFADTTKNIFFLKGIAYHEKDDLKNALTMFEQAHKQEPLEIELIRQISKNYSEKMNILNAISYFKKLEVNNDYNYIIAWYIANLYEKISLDDAERYYNKILAMKPSDLTKILTYAKLGNIAFKDKNYDKALYFLQSAEDNLDNQRFIKIKKQVIEQIISIYKYRKDFKSAALYKKKSINKSITDLLELSYFYDQFNDNKSLELLQNMYEQNPEDIRISFYLALKYFMINNLKKGIIYMQATATREKDIQRKNIYTNIVKKMLEIEKQYIDNSNKLKYTKKIHLKTKKWDPTYKVKSYLNTLTNAYFNTDIKLYVKFLGSEDATILKINLDYSKNKGAYIKVILNNAVPTKEIKLSPKELFELQALNITNDPNVYIAKFINLINIDTSSLNLAKHKGKKYIYTLNTGHKITTDKNANIISIDNEYAKLIFKKNKNKLNLPYKFILKHKKDSIKLKYLTFNYSFKEKEMFMRELENLNENKCKR